MTFCNSLEPLRVMTEDLNHQSIFLSRVASGTPCIGTISSLSDPAISEILAEAGYDFVWIDMEHSALSLQCTLDHVRALRGTGAASFVRVRWNDPSLLKPVLEMAPAGVIIPMICSAAEAAEAAAACRYPPRGKRGFGPGRGMRYGALDTDSYLSSTSAEPLVLLQIEHVSAMNALEEIIATDGVDGICVGPYDLSASMGILGQVEHPQVKEAVLRIIHTTRTLGKLAGIATDFTPAGFRELIDAGAQWLSIGIDWYHLFASSRNDLEHARNAHPIFR